MPASNKNRPVEKQTKQMRRTLHSQGEKEPDETSMRWDTKTYEMKKESADAGAHDDETTQPAGVECDV